MKMDAHDEEFYSLFVVNYVHRLSARRCDVDERMVVKKAAVFSELNTWLEFTTSRDHTALVQFAL